MAYCSKCGNPLQEGARFCAQCGTPAGQTGSENARKQEYAGGIRKCPNCGSSVPSMTAVCPDCGHELISMSTNKILKEFQEGLITYEGEAERDFVAAFPVPNTREDLGNFLSTVASILLADLNNGADTERIRAFGSKFTEIKNKVEIVLSADDPIQEQAKKWEHKINEAEKFYDKIIKEQRKKYEKERKQQKKEEERERRRENSFIRQNRGIIIVFLFLGLLGISPFAITVFIDNLKFSKETTRLEKIYAQTVEYIEKGDYTAAERGAELIVWNITADLDAATNAANAKEWEQKQSYLFQLIEDSRNANKKTKR